MTTQRPERIYTRDIVRHAVRAIASDHSIADEAQTLLDHVMDVLRPLAEDGSPVGPWTYAELETAATFLNPPVCWSFVEACNLMLAEACGRHRPSGDKAPELFAPDPNGTDQPELATVLAVLRDVLHFEVVGPVVTHRLERASPRGESVVSGSRYATVAIAPSVPTRDEHGVEFHGRVAVLAPYGGELKALAERLALVVEGHARFAAWSADSAAQHARRAARALATLRGSPAAVETPPAG